MRNKRRFSDVIIFFITLVTVPVMFWMILETTSALESAAQKEERNECIQWQKQAKEINVFYLTPWQKEQCDVVGVKIDAPVKGGQNGDSD